LRDLQLPFLKVRHNAILCALPLDFM